MTTKLNLAETDTNKLMEQFDKMIKEDGGNSLRLRKEIKKYLKSKKSVSNEAVLTIQFYARLGV